MSKVDQITRDQVNQGLSQLNSSFKKPAKKVQKTSHEEEPQQVEEKAPEIKPAEAFTVDLNVNKFEDLKINDKLKQVLKEGGFEKLTNIQRNAIP